MGAGWSNLSIPVSTTAKQEITIRIIIASATIRSFLCLIPTHTRTEEIVSTALSMPSAIKPADWEIRKQVLQHSVGHE